MIVDLDRCFGVHDAERFFREELAALDQAWSDITVYLSESTEEIVFYAWHPEKEYVGIGLGEKKFLEKGRHAVVEVAQGFHRCRPRSKRVPA